MVNVLGFEPKTYKLKVYCSTNWAIRLKWIKNLVDFKKRMGF